ncbi:MAG: diacylglycerol/lipid kinase family protein [Pyrinomonadaceae bacterium]
MSSSLPLVVVNPASAGGATGDRWPRVASDLRAHFGPFECVFTKGEGDATLLAQGETGRRMIIACGGDGTISEVASGILMSGAEVELGILPSGTGSDLRRTLRISSRPAAAAEVLKNGRTRRIDVGRINYYGVDGQKSTRFFLNSCSIGISGKVVEHYIEQRPWSLMKQVPFSGRASYAMAAVQAALTAAPPTVRLEVDQHLVKNFCLTLLCIANGRYFGGGMKIAPGAKLNDGLLDVVAISDMSALKLLSNAYRLYLGTHFSMQEVDHTTARRIAIDLIKCDQDVRFEVDGELAGRPPGVIDLLPEALSVRCPS